MKSSILAPLSVAWLVTMVLPAATGWAQAPSPKSETAQEASSPDLFVYIDDAGGLHVVSSLDLVPAPYRSRARPAPLESAGGMLVTGSSSQPPASSRRSPRATRRGANRPGDQQPDKEISRPSGTTSRQQQIEALRTQRTEALDQLGRLEEGWRTSDGDTDSGDDPSSEELDRRGEDLTRRIDELELEIRTLEQQNKR